MFVVVFVLVFVFMFICIQYILTVLHLDGIVMNKVYALSVSILVCIFQKIIISIYVSRCGYVDGFAACLVMLSFGVFVLFGSAKS